jgi:hypothetical protein
MVKKKNSYEKKAHKKFMLDGLTTAETKGSFKKTALETGRDIVVGAIGGGIAGAVVGRASFLVGIVATGAGYYFGSHSAAAFGVGMMASGGSQVATQAVSGTESEGFEGIKERLTALKEDFKHRLYLDKIIKPKTTTTETATKEETTNGMGEVQYFTYPNGKELEGANDLDMSALERIEKQVAESAKRFEAKKQESFSGNEEESVSGNEEEIGMTDFTEQNF